MESGFGILNKNPPSGRISSRVRLQKIQNLNLDFPIERNQRKIRRCLFMSSIKREVFSRRSRAETAEKCFA